MKAHQLLFVVALGGTLVACSDDNNRSIEPGGGGTPDPAAFDFRSGPITQYVKVDRMGGPITITALLSPGSTGGARRQVANMAEPADDSQFALEYIDQLRRYHFHLAPALAGLGLDTCAVVGATVEATDVSQCVTQALANPVIPDVLRFNASVVSDFPNGRKPDDQVADIVLAVALLDLGGPGGPGTCLGAPCTLRTLANLPLNVMQSTPPSLPNFPYLNNEQLAPFASATP